MKPYKPLFYLALYLSLSGCAAAFNTAVHALPSVENCHDVTYTRHGADVDITATCQIPTKSDPLLDIPL